MAAASSFRGFVLVGIVAISGCAGLAEPNRSSGVFRPWRKAPISG